LPLTETAPALQEEAATAPLTGEIQTDDLGFPEIDMNVSLPESMDSQSLEMPEDPVDRLRALIADRQDETVEILRSWMEDKEERA
jgi:flagellar M-ring protein FliF